MLSCGDIVGILNSDDFFTANDVIEKIVNVFNTKDIGSVYGDVFFVKSSNLNKIIRYYSGSLFKPSLFRFGFMPPHPSFYIRRKFYDEKGLYKTDYRIAADYELLIRYLKVNKLKTRYLNFCVVTILTGGNSTPNFKNICKILNKVFRIYFPKQSQISTRTILGNTDDNWEHG